MPWLSRLVHRASVRIASPFNFTQNALQLAAELDLRSLFGEFLNRLKGSPDDLAERLFRMEALIISWRLGDLLEVRRKLLLCPCLFDPHASILLGEDQVHLVEHISEVVLNLLLQFMLEGVLPELADKRNGLFLQDGSGLVHLAVEGCDGIGLEEGWGGQYDGLGSSAVLLPLREVFRLTSHIVTHGGCSGLLPAHNIRYKLYLIVLGVMTDTIQIRTIVREQNDYNYRHILDI